METISLKCVLVIDEALPIGLAANTATVLSITLGRRIETIVGPDVIDASEQVHTGITWLPIPILKAQADSIKAIRQQAAINEGLLVVDVSHIAQRERNYQSYTQKIAGFSADELSYLGIALYGDKKVINRLTGNLPLL